MCLIFWDEIFAKIQGAATAPINGVHKELSPMILLLINTSNLQLKSTGCNQIFLNQNFTKEGKN